MMIASSQDVSLGLELYLNLFDRRVHGTLGEVGVGDDLGGRGGHEALDWHQISLDLDVVFRGWLLVVVNFLCLFREVARAEVVLVGVS